METQISQKDKDRIEVGIRGKYVKVAQSPEGHFKYPTGRAGLETLKYDSALIQLLPEAVAASYCGVGNPFSLGEIREGESILDIGCGAGVDAILAAMIVGPSGKVVGIDMVPEMLERAKANLQMTDLNNLTFIEDSAENLNFPDNTFDVVISSGVINLIPDKESALTEIIRVLKPGGRLMVADQIAAGSVQKDLNARLANWFQ
jgi:arsenite methyltransferase